MDDHVKTDEFVSQSSIYLRTTLDERIFALTGGAELIRITLLPRLLPIQYQTIKNKIWKGDFPLEIIKFNSINYVRVSDVVKVIQSGKLTELQIRKKGGRKSNREIAENNAKRGLI